MIPGIDISKWQQGSKGIDWPTLAKWGLAQDPEFFVVVQACDGLDPNTVNPYFFQQVKGAQAAGIVNVWVYIYLRPSQGTGAAHADHLSELIGKLGGIWKNCAVLGDYEDPKVGATADLDAFAVNFDERWYWPARFHTGFYSAPYYMDPHNLNRDPRLAEMFLWLADPGSGLVVPTTPQPWRSAGKNVMIVQNNWHGQVPGIEGDVDLDYLTVDIAAMRPYMAGYVPDPLDGQAVNLTPPSVVIPSNSESTTDANTVALATLKLVDDLAAQLTDPGLHTEAETIGANLREIITATWGH